MIIFTVYFVPFSWHTKSFLKSMSLTGDFLKMMVFLMEKHYPQRILHQFLLFGYSNPLLGKSRVSKCPYLNSPKNANVIEEIGAREDVPKNGGNITSGISSGTVKRSQLLGKSSSKFAQDNQLDYQLSP